VKHITRSQSMTDSLSIVRLYCCQSSFDGRFSNHEFLNPPSRIRRFRYFFCSRCFSFLSESSHRLCAVIPAQKYLFFGGESTMATLKISCGQCFVQTWSASPEKRLEFVQWIQDASGWNLPEPIDPSIYTCNFAVTTGYFRETVDHVTESVFDRMLWLRSNTCTSLLEFCKCVSDSQVANWWRLNHKHWSINLHLNDQF
jgi:hypothetical protein